MLRGILAYATSGRPGWNTNNKKEGMKEGASKGGREKENYLGYFSI